MMPAAAAASSAMILANELHIMQMATLPTCVSIANAMIAAGYTSMYSFAGYSLEDLRQLTFYSFSMLQIRRIHGVCSRYIQNGTPLHPVYRIQKIPH
jgi:hypothetical protein